MVWAGGAGLVPPRWPPTPSLPARGRVSHRVRHSLQPHHCSVPRTPQSQPPSPFRGGKGRGWCHKRDHRGETQSTLNLLTNPSTYPSYPRTPKPPPYSSPSPRQSAIMTSDERGDCRGAWSRPGLRGCGQPVGHWRRGFAGCREMPCLDAGGPTSERMAARCTRNRKNPAWWRDRGLTSYKLQCEIRSRHRRLP